MDLLNNPQTLLIFTTSPTGLGHLRVMNALIDGLPIGLKFEELGIENVGASKIHALGSRIPILTKITEFYQTNPIAEFLVAGVYSLYNQKTSSEVIQQMADLKSIYPNKTTYVVVSTHYALARSIASYKKEIEKKLSIKIILCVVVTDDSPQRVWAVPNADIIFAPSDKTREKLQAYTKTNIKTVSFPVSPRLSQKLTTGEYEIVKRQLNPDSKSQLNIEIPVSGAAVQIDYMSTLIKNLAYKNFVFTVIGKESIYTHDFFEKLKNIPHVQLSIGFSSKQTVSLYESLFYQGARPAVEITKPSEQMFKALLSPNERGGVILLLTAPVGRQEYDNLNFLRRHSLMPSFEEEKNLQKFLDGDSSQESNVLQKASHWRGLRLPDNPNKASEFIEKLKEKGVFSAMLSFVEENQEELTSNGVKQIWDNIENLV